jgi:hypothetical protein
MLPPAADPSDPGLPSWLPDVDPPALPAPTVMVGPPAPDGPFTYGLRAKVALAKPGFGFRVEHDMPQGVELVDTRPKAKVVGQHLIWQLGRLDPGQELRLEVVVRPEPGVRISPADLATFEATYTQNLYFQSRVVHPKLTARLLGPAEVAVGAVAEFLLDVASIGNWMVEDATAVVGLQSQFEHPGGPRFEFAFGDMKPGSVRGVAIPPRAIRRGPGVIRAEVTGPVGHTAVVEFVCNVTG